MIGGQKQEMMMLDYERVSTEKAPEGAITNQAKLEEHLKSGEPLYEVTCGASVRPLKYGSDWTIQTYRYLKGSLFLYPDQKAYEDDVRCLGSLRDRHIGSDGYNDNWWFASLESAEAYVSDRVK